jgi:hypothetical protein
VALKPGGNGSGASSSQGLGQYQHAINAAHAAVATANASSGSAAAANPGVSTPTATQPPASAATAPAPAAVTKTKTTTTAVAHRHVSMPATKARSAAPSAAARFAAVQRALGAHKVLALLFYNPAGADDRAVRQELATVPARGGRVFKLAVPLSEIQNYLPIVSRVPVNVSPTLVLIAPGGQADEIVGYADPFEISQRVDDALTLRR